MTAADGLIKNYKEPSSSISELPTKPQGLFSLKKTKPASQSQLELDEPSSSEVAKIVRLWKEAWKKPRSRVIVQHLRQLIGPLEFTTIMMDVIENLVSKSDSDAWRVVKASVMLDASHELTSDQAVVDKVLKIQGQYSD